MADTVKWAAILAAIVLGLGLVLEPTLIRVLPSILHYILGAALIAIGGYGIYIETK